MLPNEVRTMPLILRFQLLVNCVLCSVHLSAAALPSLADQFDSADTVIIGSMEAGHRIPQFDSLAQTAVRDPLELHSAYPCEVTVRVDAVIKSRAGNVRQGADLPVVWYPPFTNCRPGRIGDYRLLNRDALWLLRTEKGVLRALVDNHTAVRPIANFSPEIQRELTKRKDPAEALLYLGLKPGVLIPAARYPLSLVPAEMMPVLGMATFLKILGFIYDGSNAEDRGLISLNMSTFGLCLNWARRFAKSHNEYQEWASGIQFLDPTLEPKLEETQLARLKELHTRDQVIQAWKGDAEAALSYMILLSCRSDAGVAERARQILWEYFGVSATSWSCIPCN